MVLKEISTTRGRSAVAEVPL